MGLTTGDVLHQRYRIVKLLAQGGFGTLYRAWDTALGRPCVLKENLAVSPDAQRQFLREAKILANLSHPNLPRVTDYFISPQSAQYLVMDYIEGQDLQQMLEDRGVPFPEDKVIAWAGQICDALTYLHSQSPSVIHRDVKPGNIRITPNNQAVLVDFGIAKVFDPKSKTTLGARAVSPGYSPYEQYGKGKTDARTDIYALGATLYTLLTGEEPPESVARVVNDPLVPPRQINHNLTLRTSSALMRAMQLDATQRFQNAADFKSALTPPLPVPVPAPLVVPYTAPSQPQPGISARMNPPWGWIASVALLLFIIVLLLLLIARRPMIASPQAIVAVRTITAGPILQRTFPIAGVTLPTFVGSLSPVAREPTLTPLLYLVKPGDTCSEIAQAFGVPVREIVAQNPDLAENCEPLYAGQGLHIPQSHGPIDTPAAIRSPTAQSLSVTQVSSLDGMRMVYVPTGEFRMGVEEDDTAANEFEKPEHIVYLSAFWIDLTEVTNEMYERCVQQGECRPPRDFGSNTHTVYYGDPDFNSHPVIFISWEDANSYCQWAGRRLPSEAEWEKAARGTDGRNFPWGDTPPTIRFANYGGMIGDTDEAGAYPAGASPYGLLDLAGNVAEWVNDWYAADYYAVSPYRDPSGPQEGDFRMIRGGSWFTSANALRTTARLWNYPDLQSETIGFRCAK